MRPAVRIHGREHHRGLALNQVENLFELIYALTNRLRH